MAIQNKPNMNYGVWADNGNIEIPSSEKVEQGWVIEKPLNETMNWLQNRQDRMLQYLNQRGIPEWDINTEYPVNSFVARSGTIYQAISQNQDADPTLNLAIWKIAFVTYSEFLSYSEKVDNIENEDGYLAYYVKKSDPVFDAPTRGSEYNNITNSSGYRFSGNTPVISTDGVTIAEFSGGTNPKDVVTHEQLALAIQVFKVGAVYTTTVSENPSVTFGYGTWERFAEGRALVGFSSSVSNSIPEWAKVIGSQYGSYTHTLTKAELPNYAIDLNFTTGSITGNDRPATQSTSSSPSNLVINSGGGNQPHNNVQPSVVVYFWKRVS